MLGPLWCTVSLDPVWGGGGIVVVLQSETGAAFSLSCYSKSCAVDRLAFLPKQLALKLPICSGTNQVALPLDSWEERNATCT